MNLGTSDLNLVVALKALLEECSVTHAGARIGMSQPAMSTVLSRLRRHYKDELLVRAGRDFELTPFARSLLPAVQETVHLVADAFELRCEFDPATSDRLFMFMLSDYALTVLHEPLQRRVRQLAPSVRLDFTDLGADVAQSDRDLHRYDFLVGPLGYGFPGQHELLFCDRLVCVVDAHNSRLRDGRLSLGDLAALPHAVATFRGGRSTPVDRVLDELSVDRHTLVRALGFLPLPFVVVGTDAVAVLPERLARRFTPEPRLVVVEPPFGRVNMLEALWWHPTRSADPGHRWLLSVLREVATELGDTGAGPELGADGAPEPATETAAPAFA